MKKWSDAILNAKNAKKFREKMPTLPSVNFPKLKPLTVLSDRSIAKVKSVSYGKPELPKLDVNKKLQTTLKSLGIADNLKLPENMQNKEKPSISTDSKFSRLNPVNDPILKLDEDRSKIDHKNEFLKIREENSKVQTGKSSTSSTTGTKIGGALIRETKHIKKLSDVIKVKSSFGKKSKSSSWFDLRNRMVLGKQIWIIGILLGLTATTLTILYTYEAIILQRRQKELVELEIKLRKTELENKMESNIDKSIELAQKPKTWTSFFTG